MMPLVAFWVGYCITVPFMVRFALQNGPIAGDQPSDVDWFFALFLGLLCALAWPAIVPIRLLSLSLNRMSTEHETHKRQG